MATLAPIPQDTPPPTVHSLFYGDRDDSAELESTCTCRINPFSTAIYHCNAIQHSFLTANPYTRPPDIINEQSQHESHDESQHEGQHESHDESQHESQHESHDESQHES